MLWGGLDAPRYRPTATVYVYDKVRERAGGLWTAAFMDCLLERRELFLLRNKQPCR